MSDNKFHLLNTAVEAPLPERFNCPFYYTPHPLCLVAAKQLSNYIETLTEWREELQQGKMFGVLIVQTSSGEVGFFAAFSGNIAGKNLHRFFVPPVYDMLSNEGYFRREESEISKINRRIDSLKINPEYISALKNLKEEQIQAVETINASKKELKRLKEERDKRRKGYCNEEELAAMTAESSYQKAKFKRTERAIRDKIANHEKQIKSFETELETLRNKRKERSAQLQSQLFKSFIFRNGRGEQQNLLEIFKSTKQLLPPAGAGECAAPKLLQYAYLNEYKPLTMAEFWWGNSPKGELRCHGNYYPACKGKCEPILNFMLEGIDVEENPLLQNSDTTSEPEIIYEDDFIVAVNKPSGVLSVRGKGNVFSVQEWAEHIYKGSMVVHRLDMDTSGVLLIAKNLDIYRDLRSLFEERQIQKRYIAILEGIVASDSGRIELPLQPDYLDRPRQVVCRSLGKNAITEYQVLERDTEHCRTRIAFAPLTGRTHQLRVHAAHIEGLNTPIVGDNLYGKPSERLYLHAESITFKHPKSTSMITIKIKSPF